jgi:hypothetical protein
MKDDRKLGITRYLELDPVGTQLALCDLLVARQPVPKNATFPFNGPPMALQIVVKS